MNKALTDDRGACVTPLPYVEDGVRLFAAVADRPWAMLLDSAPGGGRGRYDIVVADPYRTLLHREGVTAIESPGGPVRYDTSPPLDVLRRELGARVPAVFGLPFAGGAVGYFGYDLGRALMGLPATGRNAGTAGMAVGLYDHGVVVDHERRECWLVCAGECAPEYETLWRERLRQGGDTRAAPFVRAGETRSNLSPSAYARAFARVQRYIRDGDCYQVNLAQRFTTPVSGDPWNAYLHLRGIGAGPYSAYLNLPGIQVLSLSPESFLEVREGHVVTRPIKGTRPRGTDAANDEALKRELAQSGKDRAENVMIVDLLRNDLGKCCVPGSVEVPELFAVESFSNVHHLVSTVTGRLRPECDALDLLAGAFPGGSITGAPKRRAMAIIDELEPDPRGVYCGAIGCIGFDGTMITNIAIRTLVHRDGRLDCWAGGGIVAESDQLAEYQETFDKAAVMLRAAAD